MDIKEELKKYLDNRANEDALFAERYAKENTSIDECVDYVISCAYEKGGGKNIGVSRDEVFGWAVHYYDEDEVKIKKFGKASASASATSKNVELSEDEKQELKKRAEEEYKAMCINRLREDEKERRRKASEKKKEERSRGRS